ncbi:MAG: hypothetical protein HOU81_27470 [Hamadaea sp.]|uniref:hypothetical protein n=1 Tax=Hamadaea sp. TaxID=2024425 RepID=UPI00185A7044|nr:hypothetical protein [Hamadaea sp.]NUR74567.1 hypothetical protein [Hamadaea sp.]NUT21627.1 hypothetical protein [Hamadaea sp.]
MSDLPVPPPASVGKVVGVVAPTHNQGNAATGGIWLVEGSAGSAVLKIARPPTDPPSGNAAWPTSDDPGHWNYWRREPLAYSSGVAQAYSAYGIAAPSLLSSSSLFDGSVAFWLDVVTGTPGTAWKPSDFHAFASRLGSAQGSLCGLPFNEPWLSRDWLRSYVERTPVWARWDVDWDHPLARVWPSWVRERLASLWASRLSQVSLALAAPRTLAHLDVWIMNLFSSPTGFTLLDWAFVGEGGIGEDPANLIVDSVTDGYLPVSQLPEIDDAVTSGYIDGLRASGYTGSLSSVSSFIRAYGAAKYSWLAPAVLGRCIAEGTVGNASYGVRGTAEEELARLTGLVTMLARWADDLPGS